MAADSSSKNILGLEGGGTKTTWAVFSGEDKILAQGKSGPGNTLLLDDDALEKLLRGIAENCAFEITAIGAAFAGCQQPTEQKRVEKILRGVWPTAETVRVMEDTRSVLAAAFDDGPGIVVIAGTGANVAGQKSLHDPIEKAGGWGHLFADRGSAYDLARRGLEIAFARYDETKKITPLAREFLAASGCGTMEELVPALLRDTAKATVAQGARYVFAAAQKGDRDARALLDQAAEALASNVAVIARRLRLKSPDVALSGGLFSGQPDYQKRFRQALRKLLPGAKIQLLTVPGVLGAARVAGATMVTMPPRRSGKCFAGAPGRLRPSRDRAA